MTQAVASVGNGIARDTAAITGLNFLSRATGFVRVLAMAAALGATSLGNAYQSANLVSNILFELLAGGLLAAVLVPVFVERFAADDRAGALALAGALLGRALAGLTLIVAILMVAADPLMRLLTIGASTDRDAQIELGSYLLLFFLPQILLYATGAVATALLHADRRFIAAAAAPVANNLVVIVTMVGFRLMRDGGTDLPLAGDEMFVLAVGTTAGVAAMTLVPLFAVRRAGSNLIPRWGGSPVPLRPLAAKGFWAAGHLGLNQVMVAATIVLAAQVEGGVVAYQIAFTFFLLPHGLLANPIYTVMFPRFARHAQEGRLDDFADDVGLGLRLTALLLVPAAGLLLALAGPVLTLVRLGNLDQAGADLVAVVLAGYSLGLLGYSAFFLLTRASYALDDARSPTIVNGYVTAVALPAMVITSTLADGDAKVAVLGVVNAVAVVAGSTGLFLVVRRQINRLIPCLAAIARAIALTVVASGAAYLVARWVGDATRSDAALAVGSGAGLGLALYATGQFLWGADDVRTLLRTAR
ncbi:MAG TPA: lipid II flippase MurJ [Acidimicrobiales bacterium]|nr:lipid II flippase MurJ [Acidimicrobiales bacterium]